MNPNAVSTTSTLSGINDMIENDKPKILETPKENINEDEVLFKIWHIINAFDDKLYQELIKSDIKTMTDLKTKDLTQLADTINFESMNEYTTKELFVRQINQFKPVEYSDNDLSSSSSSESDSFVLKCKRKKKKKDKKGRRDNNIGFSVGGAKDINSFRLKIDTKQMPKDNSITYQGIFYDYYFDTGSGDDEEEEKEQEGDDGKMDVDDEKKPLFYPCYNFAKSVKPEALKLMEKLGKSNNDNNNNNIFDALYFNDNNNNTNTNDNSLKCICGKPFEELICKTCYDGSGVECDRCGKDIALNKKVYHCPDNENKVHKEGYDLCSDCANDFEYFITIGLNSNIKQSDFKRKKLNLVVVLDISGSMRSGFGGGGRRKKRRGKRGRGGVNSVGSKMRVANEV